MRAVLPHCMCPGLTNCVGICGESSSASNQHCSPWNSISHRRALLLRMYPPPPPSQSTAAAYSSVPCVFVCACVIYLHVCILTYPMYTCMSACIHDTYLCLCEIEHTYTLSPSPPWHETSSTRISSLSLSSLSRPLSLSVSHSLTHTYTHTRPGRRQA